ncbi:MAG: cell division protein FtsA [Acidobacteria bacterium]|nr:cell division protein FtsA [Acidobacteriota bacterium]
MNELSPLVGIDVGSAAVSVVVAIEDEGRIRVVGSGRARHEGARKDVISELGAVAEAVREAAEEAEAMSSLPVEQAVVGLGGTPVTGMCATASVPITGRASTVCSEDQRRALRACTRMNIPDDYEVLSILPAGFAVDGQGGLRTAVGMPGKRLDASAYVLFTHKTHAQAVVQAVNTAGIVVKRLTYEPVAAAESVLTNDERDLGCLLLDLGYGSSEWVAYSDGVAVASGAIPVGGRLFTNDLAVLIKTTTEAAERVKREVGATPTRSGAGGGGVEVPAIGEQGHFLVERGFVSEILSERARDLFVRVHRQMIGQGVERTPRAGVVLTGGGARLIGITELAQEIFGFTARLGTPRGLTGSTEPVAGPEWSVACGLALEEHRAGNDGSAIGREGQTGILSWLRNALNELFEIGGGR